MILEAPDRPRLPTPRVGGRVWSIAPRCKRGTPRGGSNPSRPTQALVAQWIAHQPPELGAVSSNLTEGAQERVAQRTEQLRPKEMAAGPSPAALAMAGCPRGKGPACKAGHASSSLASASKMLALWMLQSPRRAGKVPSGALCPRRGDAAAAGLQQREGGRLATAQPPGEARES